MYSYQQRQLKRKNSDGDGAHKEKKQKLRKLPATSDSKAPMNHVQNRNGPTADFFAQQQPQLHHPHTIEHAAHLQFPNFFQNVPTMDVQLQQQPEHDASLFTVAPQDQVQSSGFMPFTFNYKDMTITRHAEFSSEKNSKGGKSAPDMNISSEKSIELLENVIVVASMSCDLTALYLMLSMSAHIFNGPLFSNRQFKTRNHDVIINADNITNHPGNIILAESIQSYHGDYLQSGYSNKTKDDIVQLIYATVTNNIDDESAKKGRFLIKDISSNGKSHWSVLQGSDACSMIKSLFEQACAYILNPGANDVLCGCDDRSRVSPGNIVFKSIIRRCKALFLQSPPEKKMQYATEIVTLVTSRTGRFLEYIENMDMWTPLHFESAIEHTQEQLDASTGTGEGIQMQNPIFVNPMRIAPNELIQSLHHTTPSSNFATTIQQFPILHDGNIANQFTYNITAANFGGPSPLAIQGPSIFTTVPFINR